MTTKNEFLDEMDIVGIRSLRRGKRKPAGGERNEELCKMGDDDMRNR